ncbi:MAG: Type IV secretory pathway, VirD4 component, TraG/TraD family ATPase [Candidatus Electronema aureum]|uniref:Type IV secretory pathway, VirD4 component, TraG/TraD family ATPase n=1 Tax=Candidatus Electronema aureum TaxID=2005002 RepID=A0A521FZE8_9BACT|nr:MAG: Type IV secretory pathway, VirD4 component, TraG/TraD family ATPase [Candidatus Electronema aureum]
MIIFKLIFGWIIDILLTGGKYLLYGRILKNKTGSKILTPKEIKSFLSPAHKGLLIDGAKNRLSVAESFQNVCFVARVGAGKTTKYIIPNVLDKGRQNVSMVVNDPKGEVYSLTAGYLQANGYKIIVYNPHNLLNSNLFNPLLEAKNHIELEQIAETLIWIGNPGDKDPFWNNGASRIISVLLKCLSFSKNKQNFNLPNLYYLLQNFGEMGEGLDKWISRNCWDPTCPNDRYVLNEWKGVLTGNQETVQSFVGVCLTSLKALSNRDLQGFFSDSDYKLTNLRKQKTAIFFITPPEHQQYYSFVTSLFFRAVFNECMRDQHLRGKSLPVYILYDEFGNSYITDFVSVANTIRGYGVSLSIVLQSISQLAMKYGQNTSEAIQGALNTNICLSSSDPVTSKFFSELSGRVRERQVRDIEKNIEDYREYNLLNTDDVRTMGQDEALIISKNRYPVRLKVVPYYNNRIFKKASLFPKPNFSNDERKINVSFEQL